jgi:hypothetical protein
MSISVFIGKVSVQLLLPLKWEDKEIKVVELDFSTFRGDLINKVQRECFNNEGNISAAILPAQTPEYCARIASAISGVPFRALEKMNAFDYETICHTVGAYINKRNPQKFYDQYIKLRDTADDDDEEEGEAEKSGFTPPAAKPGKS